MAADLLLMNRWMIRYIVPMFNSYRCIQRKEQASEQRLLRFW